MYKYHVKLPDGTETDTYMIEHLLYPKEIKKVGDMLGTGRTLEEIEQSLAKIGKGNIEYYYRCRSGKLKRCYPECQWVYALYPAFAETIPKNSYGTS